MSDHSRRRLLSWTGAALLGLVVAGRRQVGHPGPRPPQRNERPPARRVDRPTTTSTTTTTTTAAPPPATPPPNAGPPIQVGTYEPGPTVPIPDPLPTPPPYNTLPPNRVIELPLTPIPVVPPAGWDEHVVGWSATGVPIQMFTSQGDDVRRRVLVITCVHGNERGTGPIAERLLHVPRPSGVQASIVPILNPDGWIRDRRHNARNVDLNRNYPWRWAPSDGGPFAGSEPETQAAMALVQAYPWDIVVWIHQPLGYVAAVPPSDRAFAEVWGRASGLPYRENLDQPGGGETWTAKAAGVPSMLVEVAGHDVTVASTEAHAAGFAALLDLLASY